MTDVPNRSCESVFDTLQSELGNLWQRFWHSGISTGPFDGQDFAPPIELREYPDRYVLMVELPGVTRETIEVNANATTITLAGQKAEPAFASNPKTPSVHMVRSDRRYGRFRREIIMPGAIQPETTSARLCDGVLEVTAIKPPHSTPISIQVKLSHS
ncbi:MAG: Hsp20/alpha crystallin family protein [Phycisphaerales bacterium]|nr:Hsp20/alpha crystallin family protein [Phycisphaerales bacterium]